MKRKESFPIDKTLLNKLTNVFNKLKKPETNSNKYVYVNLSMVRLQMIWVLPKLLYGMGAAEADGAKVAAITWNENKEFTEFLSSLGIDHVCLETENRKNIIAGFKAVWTSLLFVLKNAKGEDLQNLKINGLPAGRAIYEDILRTSELSTIRTVRNKVCIKKMIHILWMVYSLDSYLKKHNPVFCIADDIAYHEGIQLALFKKYGAKVYNMNIIGDSKVYFNNDYTITRWGEIRCQEYHDEITKIGKEAVKKAEELLDQRFHGKNGRDIDRGAFCGKEVINREEAEKKLGLEHGKKNIVIMAHTFTDAIFNYGNTCYKDYYDWIEKTLMIARRNDTVNWILKPHPTRKAYHESADSIESMFERNKENNMYFMSDDISAESIKDIADVMITIGGNAGAEFSCFGIPVIILGKPYYRGFGYTIEPKTQEEYEELLLNIETITKLNYEQIETAKKVFFLRNTLEKTPCKFNDDLFQILRKQDKKMSDEYALEMFESNEGSDKYNNDIIEELIDYFENFEIKNCQYYMRGKERANEE